ncbi:InlB B-repeat-containing protein [Pontibacter saemangeumensis]
MPLKLDFDGSEVGIPDVNGLGTGFTLVDAYSGTRLTPDGPTSDPAVPGYESTKMVIVSGRLKLTSNKGIAYQKNNNQINSLGVRVDSRGKLQIETVLLNPYAGANAEQAGLWIGLNDKTFIKLAVSANRVELRRELNDISAGSGSADQRITGTIIGLNTQVVRLRLLIDPAQATVEGYYSTDGTTYKNVGQAYNSPALSIAGMGLTSSTAHTGIYATHRNGSTPVTYTFDSFSVDVPGVSADPGVSTQIISNLTSTTGRSYTLAEVALGVKTYTDRTNQITSIPSTLSGAAIVQTANDDKWNTTGTLVSFDLSQQATVYIAYDPRATALPSWLSGWQKLADRVGVNDSKISYMQLYSKSFPAGTVSLGGNMQSPAAGAQNNYFIIAKAAEAGQYTLSVSTTGSGSVSKSPNQTSYAAGTSVSLTATAASGYQFSGWSGDASGTSNPLSLTMNSNKTITANFTPVQTSGLVSNLAATTGRSYILADLVVGALHYTDRTYKITSVPASLDKAKLIRTANDDKRNTSSSLLSFTLSQQATVYIAYDPRATSLPSWLSGWQKLADRVGVNDSKISYMQLYSKSFPAGTVSLGGNMQSPAAGAENNYFVAVQGTASSTICSPISMLSCDQLQVSLPLSLSFSSSVSNSVPDKNGVGTGFTMVDTYSGTRLAADGAPTNTNVPGYETSKLTVTGGQLQVVTNKGIAYLSNNNQLNTLGVRVNSRGQLKVETTLINPYYGTASEQAGLWFGLNDKSFIKLVVSGNKVELRKEHNDASANSEMRITGTISGLSSKTVRLRLEVDPTSGTVQGFYSTDGSTYLNVGASYSAPGVSIAGMNLTSSTAYAGIFATHRNATSPVTYTFDDFTIKTSLRPYVTAVRPADGAAYVPLDQSISVDLAYPSGKSIDGNTVNTSTVKLHTVAIGGGTEVTGTAVNATAAGDAITLSAPLKAGTTYEFSISDQVKDGNGYAMVPFTSRFTTTNFYPETPTDLQGVSFTEQTLIDNTFGTVGFTSLVIGPDRRLYAASADGKIERWDIRADGTFANHITIAPFGATKRLLIGFEFDPAATGANLIAWISHSSGEFNNPPEWSSKISKINLNNPASPQVVDYVINLPRSYKDHTVNSIDFGPDGALYIVQGSNTAMGDPDLAWGERSERLLTAAVLRLDITKADQQSLPINAQTADGGTYNPYASTAPLTIYATGVRNAYDLVWHSNGELYVPTNGSAAGGNTPALLSGTKWSNGQVYSGSDIQAMSDVRASQNDYLFRVQKGGYYGHPNKLRNEYIMNGGNPTDRQDPGEVVWTENGASYGYPVGTPIEPNYRGWAYDFGLNISPNGIIEFKSNAFGGKLQGKLLVCRFSGGDDVMVLEPGATNKDIIRATEGIKVPGLRRPFANPLDVVEDVRTGNLYISEYYDGNGDGKPRITLLKADQPATTTAAISTATISASKAGGEVSSSLEIYPNPTPGGKLFVNLKDFGQHEPVEVSITDVSGRIIQSRTLVTDAGGAGNIELTIGKGTNHGLYIIRAVSPTVTKVGKLIVQ